MLLILLALISFSAGVFCEEAFHEKPETPLEFIDGMECEPLVTGSGIDYLRCENKEQVCYISKRKDKSNAVSCMIKN